MSDSAEQFVLSFGSVMPGNTDSDPPADVREILESGCRAAAAGAAWRLSEQGGGWLAVRARGPAAGRLIGPWVQAAYWELRRRNAGRSVSLRISAGFDLTSDDSPGLAAYLRESEPAAWLLATVPQATLLVALSERVRQAVLDAGAPGFEAADLADAVVALPSGPVRGWFQLTGHPARPIPAVLPEPAAASSQPVQEDGDPAYRVSAERDTYIFGRNTFHGRTTIGSQDGGA